MPAKHTQLAVLIDADNASPGIVEGLLTEVAKFGTASVKRIYGDWTTPNLGGWKSVLLDHSIQPVQQFRYTTGKNATDSALIIDAMDLLYSGRLNGFCIVSSDSDFTRLAARLRESGMVVYGFGEKKTPKPFVAACDRFIFTELLMQSGEADEPAVKPRKTNELKGDTRLVKLIRDAMEPVADDVGWAHLGAVGNQIPKISSEFDPRDHGYKKLSDLLRATGLFELKLAEGGHIMVRDKKRKKETSAEPTS